MARGHKWHKTEPQGAPLWFPWHQPPQPQPVPWSGGNSSHSSITLTVVKTSLQQKNHKLTSCQSSRLTLASCSREVFHDFFTFLFSKVIPKLPFQRCSISAMLWAFGQFTWTVEIRWVKSKLFGPCNISWCPWCLSIASLRSPNISSKDFSSFSSWNLETLWTSCTLRPPMEILISDWNLRGILPRLVKLCQWLDLSHNIHSSTSAQNQSFLLTHGAASSRQSAFATSSCPQDAQFWRCPNPKLASTARDTNFDKFRKNVVWTPRTKPWITRRAIPNAKSLEQQMPYCCPERPADLMWKKPASSISESETL